MLQHHRGLIPGTGVNFARMGTEVGKGRGFKSHLDDGSVAQFGSAFPPLVDPDRSEEKLGGSKASQSPEWGR